MPNPANIGITLASSDAIQSVELEKKLSEVVVKDKSGGFLYGNNYDPLITASVKMVGDSGEAAGAAMAMSITGITGGVTLVKDLSVNTNNEGYPESSFSVEHAPSAS